MVKKEKATFEGHLSLVFVFKKNVGETSQPPKCVLENGNNDCMLQKFGLKYSCRNNFLVSSTG